MDGHALVLMAANEAEEVLAENFEDHADVGAVRAYVFEVIKEGDDVGSTGVSARVG